MLVLTSRALHMAFLLFGAGAQFGLEKRHFFLSPPKAPPLKCLCLTLAKVGRTMAFLHVVVGSVHFPTWLPHLDGQQPSEWLLSEPRMNSNPPPLTL